MRKITYESLIAIIEDGFAENAYDLGQLFYDITEAGICTSFEMPDGSFVVYSDLRDESDPDEKVRAAVGIRFSSVVEGSCAEVPATQLRFPFTEEALLAAANTVSDEACALWEEAHGGEEDAEDDESAGVRGSVSVRNVDFTMLRKQREALTCVLTAMKYLDREENSVMMDIYNRQCGKEVSQLRRDLTMLEGLQNFLDHCQDCEP